MNKHFKLLLAIIVTTLIPLKNLAQQPVQTKLTEINIHNVQTIEERVFLIHSIQESEFFSYRLSDEEGKIDIYVSDEYTCQESNANEDFDDFLEHLEVEWMAYNNLDKTERGALFVEWRYQLDDPVFLMINEDFHSQLRNRDNSTCDGADPFCTDNGLYQFPAGVNAGNLGSSTAPYYCSGFVRPNGQGSTNCLYTTPNPAFYYMQIDQPGNLDIYMYSTPSHDIDFDCWGPFSDINTACSQLSCSNMVDCSYSANSTEHCYINNAQTGQYYILLITNYSNSTCNINFSNTGTGTTNCGILPPLVGNSGPYCVGETINLTAHGQSGASYSWSGPGNFSSNQQNPTRPNCTMAMAGTYTCTITVGSQTNSATTDVVVYPQPTANFTFTSVCQGTPTQFTSTSTTNPSGQQITSFLWDFGGGQTSTQQNPSYTFPRAGTFPVTLTVSCGNGHCTSSKTENVTVYAAPVANAGPDQTIPYGSSAQLSGSGGTGTFNFHWEPANMVTNANTQNTQTVTLTQDQTYTITVTNPQGGCSSTDEVTIHINGSAMTVTAGPDISICQGGSGQIYVNAGGGTGNLTYSWTPTTGLSNPNIYNPIASPSQTTTYTCHVTDGQTSQNVSVTVTVNDVIIENEYVSICPDDVYHWHGTPYTGVGTYQFDTVTSQGCDKTIYLHLDHYPTYDETVIEEAICFGETYTFYGTTYNHSFQTSYTDHTIHGCDSIVRLELTVWPENQIEEISIPLCPDQLPYYYEEDPNQIPLYEGLHIFHPEDEHGCERTVHIDIQVSEYYMPPTKLEHVCELPYIWEIRDVDNSLLETITIDSANFYIDTVQTAACQGIFRLDLRYQPVPETIVEDTAVCDSYEWPVSGQTYDHSDTYNYYVSMNPYPCDQEYQLNLVVNKSDLTGEPEHPEYFDKQCDSIQFEWFGNTTYFKENGDYLFSSIPNPNAFIVDLDAHTQTVPGCDTATMVKVTNMKYTPLPDKFGPSDGTTVWFGIPEEEPIDPTNDTAMCAAVVTNTEFFSFQYQFYVEDAGKSVWDTCIWTIDKASWHITPEFSSDKKSSTCWVYVADRDEDFVVLTATAKNSCGEKTKRFYLKSSFLDVDENELAPAKVNIVPNPNNGQMHLDFENMQGRTAVKVFDMTGNQIDAFETTINSNRYNYDYNLKKHANGIYFFVISNNNRLLTKKVVIIH